MTKRRLSPLQRKALTWLGIGAGVGVLYYLAKNELKKVGAAVNPVSDKNIFYQGAGSLLQHTVGASTGNTTMTPGTAEYDLLHEWVRKPDGTLVQVLKVDAWLHPSWVQVDPVTGKPVSG